MDLMTEIVTDWLMVIQMQSQVAYLDSATDSQMVIQKMTMTETLMVTPKMIAKAIRRVTPIQTMTVIQMEKSMRMATVMATHSD